VTRQEDNESDEVPWGEFLRVVIIGEYNVAYCWSFSRTDAHPSHAVDKTNISAHSCNPSEQLFSVASKGTPPPATQNASQKSLGDKNKELNGDKIYLFVSREKRRDF